MAQIIPETVTRLQAAAIVCDTELAAYGKGEVLRIAAHNMVERALRKLLEDCVETERDAARCSTVLRLDVYVMTPAELEKIIADARIQGERDAARWGLLA